MKIFTGKVITKKNEKTATIAVERVVVHPVYKKRIKRTKKYQVHDEFGAEVNQIVKFATSKPFSKTKRWKIVEVISTSKTKNEVKVKKNVKEKSKKSTVSIK